MGTLSEEVAALKQRVGGRCTVGVWLATLGKADRAEVADVMASEAYGSTITRAVEKVYGVKFADSTVQRHRRGACSCPR